MLSEAPPPRSAARPPSPMRASSQQLTLPLLPPGPPGPAPPALVPLVGAVRVRPRQVWAGSPPPVRAEVRRRVWQVLEEVIRDEHHP
jgi:hypothetical protein